MNWSTVWPLLVGGGGGGSVVQLARIGWKDKKKIEEEYRQYREDIKEFVDSIKEGYETVTDDLNKIKQKLGIED